jgi:aryl-alcohol dehydrogenase-like predicted oxidoreductase
MRYKLLGRSGLRVSEAALGTMTFGEEWGWGASKEECRRIFDAFVAAGGNFVDTANRYTEGTSERFVGEFVAAERERFVIGTKYTLFNRKGDPNAAGNQRKNMVQSLEASLKRLGTDYVDLLWMHAWDAITPIDEVMRGLDDLVRAGKVLYVGISDTPAWVVSRANTLAELRGWTPFAALQIEYSLIERSAERELLPMAHELGLAVTPWGTLAGGVLTGKYRADRSAVGGPARYAGNASVQRLSERNLTIAGVVSEVAHETGRSPAQVALAWVRARDPLIIPILGARRVEQLQDDLAALDLTLGEPQMTYLDEASRIELGFPYDFLAQESIRELVYGSEWRRIDRGR